MCYSLPKTNKTNNGLAITKNIQTAERSSLPHEDDRFLSSVNDDPCSANVSCPTSWKNQDSTHSSPILDESLPSMHSNSNYDDEYSSTPCTHFSRSNFSESFTRKEILSTLTRLLTASENIERKLEAMDKKIGNMDGRLQALEKICIAQSQLLMKGAAVQEYFTTPKKIEGIV